MSSENDAAADEALVAFCGLYCGDCHGYKQDIPNLARDLRKALRQAKYKEFADFMATSGYGRSFQAYEQCYEVLGAMLRFRCHKGCRRGGGNPFCKIRACAVKRKLEGCWECTDSDECTKLDYLVPVHGEAHAKNIRRIRKSGLGTFVRGKRHW